MTCVYTTPAGLCPGTDPLSKREHYLSRALGNFRGDERLVDKICDGCQRRFRDLEDVLAHNSPEAFFREMVGQIGRRNHSKKNIFYEPTMGLAPLSVIARSPGNDFDMLWEPIDQRYSRPLSQFVFIRKDSSSAQMPFRLGKDSLETALRFMKRNNCEKPASVVGIWNSPEECGPMNAVIDALSPKGTDGTLAPLKDGVGIEAEMKSFISDKYVRAIAKIGFHFFLKFFPRFTGMEPEFDDVKRFIYVGSASQQIVRRVPQTFAIEFRRGATPKNWCHLLSAQCDDRGIEARLQFFAGPAISPIVLSILIGKNPSRIIYTENAGYGYLFFKTMENGFHGNRLELKAIRNVIYL
jgi:hypothetical protein